MVRSSAGVMPRASRAGGWRTRDRAAAFEALLAQRKAQDTNISQPEQRELDVGAATHLTLEELEPIGPDMLTKAGAI